MNLASSVNPQIPQVLVKDAAQPPDTQTWQSRMLSKLDWQQKYLSRLRISVWNLILILVLVYVVSVAVRMVMTQTGLAWLFQIPTVSQPTGDLSVVLAPLVAVAVAIERLLQTVFDWYEKSLVSVARVLQSAEQTEDWIQNEVRGAYSAVQTAAGKYLESPEDSVLELFEKAQKRLADAESRLMDWVQAPEYVSWKRAICIIIGLCAGVVVAVFSDLGLMRIIGVPAPRIVDLAATGLVIGAGPAPMHSILGILDSSKKAVDNLANLMQSKTLANAAQTIQSSVDAAKGNS